MIYNICLKFHGTFHVCLQKLKYFNNTKTGIFHYLFFIALDSTLVSLYFFILYIDTSSNENIFQAQYFLILTL